jgi:hypothetical protein
MLVTYTHILNFLNRNIIIILIILYLNLNLKKIFSNIILEYLGSSVYDHSLKIYF